MLPVWVRDLTGSGPRGLLAWQAITSAVGIFLATALMALYLVGPAELSDRLAGIILMSSALLCLVATPSAGRLIRRWGPRRFAIASCLSRGLLFVALPLSVNSLWTCGIVLTIGICEAAAFSVYQLLIADVVGEALRTEVLAIRRTLGNVGFTFGGIAVGGVVADGSRKAYFMAFVLCGLAMCIAALFLWRLPDSHAFLTPAESELKDRTERGVGLRDVRFLGLIAAATIMATSLHLLTIGVPLWVVRRTEAPRGIIGLLLVLNTILVVLLQVRFSKPASRWNGARKLVIGAGVLMALSVLLVAAAAYVSAWAAASLLVVAAVAAAIAEMWDSAGWWTISYEYPAAEVRTDYLAAFDVITPTVNMVGPPLMLWIVNAGSFGWFAYAILFFIASITVHLFTSWHRDEMK